MKRINPFEKIYQKINHPQTDKAKPAYPLLIDMELTNKCNFECLMCPTGMKVVNRPQGMMSDDVFYKIADELIAEMIPVRFSRWGEPFMHEKLVEYVGFLKKNGVLVHINTNGFFLTPKVIHELIEMPLDSIKISLQGVNEASYHNIRNNPFYYQILNNVKSLFDMRGDRPFPYIHVSTTIVSGEQDLLSVLEEDIRSRVDKFTSGTTVFSYVDENDPRLSPGQKESIHEFNKRKIAAVRFKHCPEVFAKLSVNFDGSVSACCRDYDNMMLVGGVKRDSLKAIWDSEKMNSYRNLLQDMSSNRFLECSLCRKCYDYIESY